MGIPLLYHAHNLMGDELETYFEGRLLRGVSALLGRALDRRVPRLADQCVSVSRHTQARLIELTGSPVAYQPPAVEYGERSGNPVASDVVYAGNMDGYQGIELLDEALQRLPLLRCTVVSRAPWCGRAQVHWVRERSFAQVKAHLEGARLAVLPRCVPSGFPVKLINYLYAGLPVVACQSGAQGLGIDDGVVVVPDGDATGFASAIDRLLEDTPRRELLAQRAAEAAKRFSWASHVVQLEQMYRDVVAGAKKRPAAGQESAQQRVWSEGVT
jgi:glycosyltransferase involved in cell wall biosynthesis